MLNSAVSSEAKRHTDATTTERVTSSTIVEAPRQASDTSGVQKYNIQANRVHRGGSYDRLYLWPILDSDEDPDGVKKIVSAFIVSAMIVPRLYAIRHYLDPKNPDRENEEEKLEEQRLQAQQRGGVLNKPAREDFKLDRFLALGNSFRARYLYELFPPGPNSVNGVSPEADFYLRSLQRARAIGATKNPMSALDDLSLVKTQAIEYKERMDAAKVANANKRSQAQTGARRTTNTTRAPVATVAAFVVNQMYQVLMVTTGTGATTETALQLKESVYRTFGIPQIDAVPMRLPEPITGTCHIGHISLHQVYEAICRYIKQPNWSQSPNENERAWSQHPLRELSPDEKQGMDHIYFNGTINLVSDSAAGQHIGKHPWGNLLQMMILTLRFMPWVKTFDFDHPWRKYLLEHLIQSFQYNTLFVPDQALLFSQTMPQIQAKDLSFTSKPTMKQSTAKSTSVGQLPKARSARTAVNYLVNPNDMRLASTVGHIGQAQMLQNGPEVAHFYANTAGSGIHRQIMQGAAPHLPADRKLQSPLRPGAVSGLQGPAAGGYPPRPGAAYPGQPSQSSGYAPAGYPVQPQQMMSGYAGQPQQQQQLSGYAPTSGQQSAQSSGYSQSGYPGQPQQAYRPQQAVAPAGYPAPQPAAPAGYPAPQGYQQAAPAGYPATQGYQQAAAPQQAAPQVPQGYQPAAAPQQQAAPAGYPTPQGYQPAAAPQQQAAPAGYPTPQGYQPAAAPQQQAAPQVPQGYQPAAAPQQQAAPAGYPTPQGYQPAAAPQVPQGYQPAAPQVPQGYQQQAAAPQQQLAPQVPQGYQQQVATPQQLAPQVPQGYQQGPAGYSQPQTPAGGYMQQPQPPQADRRAFAPQTPARMMNQPAVPQLPLEAGTPIPSTTIPLVADGVGSADRPQSPESYF